MTDHAPTLVARPPAQRPTVAHSVLTLAAAATTSAALVWSALFYSAMQKHTAAGTSTGTSAAQVAPANSATQPASSAAPVTTRTS